MPIVTRTGDQLRQDLAYMLNDLVYMNGSAYAPVNASLISDNIITTQRVDALKGAWLYLWSGGGATGPGWGGQERQIWGNTMYTPAGSLASIQVLQPMSPVPSTNVGWEVHRIWSPTQKHLAINRALRRGARVMLTRGEDYANISNSILLDGGFHRWANGASSAPDSWTQNGGTTARSANFLQGVYAAALSNTLNNTAELNQSVTDFAKYSGAGFRLKAWAYTTTGSRVRLQLYDGVNTFNSSYHDGTGMDDENNLEINNTLATNLTELTVRLRIETGSAITATWLKVSLSINGTVIYQYEIPTTMTRISDVWMEGSNTGVFDVRIPRRWWDVNRQVSPRRLRLLRTIDGERAWDPATGKGLKIVGQAFPPQIALGTDSVAIDPEYVLTRAAVDLLAQYPVQARDAYPDYDRWLRQAEQMEARSSTRPDTDSVEVEPQ